jgi:GDP-L-fucose synthase
VTNFWQGKRVVVTGGCGMMGARLVRFLLDEGADVDVLDNRSRGQQEIRGANYPIKPASVADATKEEVCEAFFDGVDVVFNLVAAVGGLYHNLSHQLEQFTENVKLQTAPVIAAAQVGVPVFVQVSTVCVYGCGMNDPAIEFLGHFQSPEKANEGYAWAKRMGEHACRWAFENTPTRWMVVRPTNCYGIGDYFDDKPHVIPAIIKKFESGECPVRVFGGDQKREFIYVDDAARAMMAVAEHGTSGEAYNAGTGGDTQVTIRQLAGMIGAAMGSTARIAFVSDAPTGDATRSTNAGKLRALGWRHEVGLDEGLQRTIEWRQKVDLCRSS